jgi:hypothetical protein
VRSHLPVGELLVFDETGRRVDALTPRSSATVRHARAAGALAARPLRFGARLAGLLDIAGA